MAKVEHPLNKYAVELTLGSISELVFQVRLTPEKQDIDRPLKADIGYPEGVSVHRRERIFGEFDRTLSLPVQLEPDGIKAEYHDGILALFLPRSERDKPRTIKIS